LILKGILKRWIDNILSFILKRVGYWSSGLYDFSLDQNRAELIDAGSGPARKWIIVVGRGFYFETSRDYPIGHLGDLKKLLANEPWRFPHEGLLLSRIDRLNDQCHRVTSWVIKQEVLDSLGKRPLWVLPESACIEGMADESVVVLERLGKKLYVAVSPDGLFSSLGQEGSFLSRLGLAGNTFDAGDAVVSRLYGTAAIETILLGTIESLKRFPFRFYIGLDKDILKSYGLGRSLKLTAAIFLAYLSITSVFLMLANGWVDHRLSASASEAESAMRLRTDVSRFHDQVNDFNQIAEGIYPMWIAWDVLLDLERIGVSFRAVNSSPPSVTYYLTAPRATDILNWLSQDSRILEAEFALPVRKIDGSEQFAIEVTFRRSSNSKKEGLISGS